MVENKAYFVQIGFVQLVHTLKGEKKTRGNRRGRIGISSPKTKHAESKFDLTRLEHVNIGARHRGEYA